MIKFLGKKLNLSHEKSSCVPINNLINASRGFQNKSNYNYFAIRDSNLFKKHKIDCLTFVLSNDYYTKNPKLYLKIYDRISEQIKKIKDSVNNSNN